MEVEKYIHSDPKIMLGKPVVKGTRITVELVLLKLSEGYSIDELIQDYPSLSEDSILSCLTYAAQVIQSEKIINAA